MNFKRKQLFLMSVFILFFVFVSHSPAEENKQLQISFYTMVYSVTSYEDLAEVNFITHVPIITDDSVPIFLKLSEEEKYNLNVSDFSFKDVRGDQNLIRFTLNDCIKDEKTYIAFEVYTLKKVCNYEDIPEMVPFSSYSNLGSDLQYYLRPSPNIQSDDPEIRSKAYEFFYGSWGGRDGIEISNEIMHFTGGNAYPGTNDQTAIGALHNRAASCTGNANLAAALCRALGVPARILFVLPTHYIVEVWIPGYGWVRGESTLGIFPHPKQNWTIQWIANIDDEYYGGIGVEGVVAYWGFEDIVDFVDGTWDIEYGEIHSNRYFATIEGDADLNDILFEKGEELWRLFCQIKNSELSDEELGLFSEYQQLYFESLVDNKIQDALAYVDKAISEAKRLLNI